MLAGLAAADELVSLDLCEKVIVNMPRRWRNATALDDRAADCERNFAVIATLRFGQQVFHGTLLI